jgi:hypothetical protein
MAEITPTPDDDLDDAAGHRSCTYNHKYDGAITEEPTDYDDDHSGIVVHTKPLRKQTRAYQNSLETPPLKDPERIIPVLPKTSTQAQYIIQELVTTRTMINPALLLAIQRRKYKNNTESLQI